jgi:hypothetical protein
MEQTNQITVTVDGQEYPMESLPAAAQEQVVNLRFVEQEIARLHSKLAVLATAKNAYQAALQSAMPHTLQ